MKRLVSIAIVAIFLLWLLPLGIFIKPSQEKILCGGQRAVCLCSGKVAKAAVENSLGEVTVKSTGAPQKEQNPSSGGVHLFTIAHRDIIEPNMRLARALNTHISLYSDPSLSSLEHVPKA